MENNILSEFHKCWQYFVTTRLTRTAHCQMDVGLLHLAEDLCTEGLLQAFVDSRAVSDTLSTMANWWVQCKE